jgi:hypothetical protein
LKKKDEDLYTQIKYKLSNNKVSDEEWVSVLKKSEFLGTKMKILDHIMEYKKIQVIQKEKLKNATFFKNSILIVLRFVIKLKLRVKLRRLKL